MGGLRAGDAAGPPRERRTGRRDPVPDGINRVPDAGRSAAGGPGRPAPGSLAPVRAGERRCGARRRTARVRAAAEHALQVRSRPGDRLARRGFSRERPGTGPLRPRFRERPPRPQGQRRDEPPLCRRARAHADRLDCGSSPAARPERHRVGGARSLGRHRGRLFPDRTRGPGQVGRRRGRRPGRASGRQPGGRRPRSAGRGPRAGPCHELGARQRRRHRRPYRARGTAGGAGRVAAAARGRDERRCRAAADRPRRQPGLHGARRPEVRRSAGQGPRARSSRPLRR